MDRKKIFVTGILGLVLCIALAHTPAWEVEAAPQPKVEVVFCLDTTGSMSGLIEGAKQKIWSIANQIVKGKPTPQLRIGLVGYRDYGDGYITRVFPLNDDLDAVFDDLMSFRAAGGGDTPEHVNKALHDAVHQIDWSRDQSTLKLIFLVGDCPPHMDYQDGYDYRKACREAVEKDIIINTVQCGDYEQTVSYWRKIARLGEGSYAAIPQEGGMKIVETPFDAELSQLNAALEGTIVAFGTAEEKDKSAKRRGKVSKMAPSMAAERAVYKSVDSEISSYDLIDAVHSNSVELEKLEDRYLPDEMRCMSLQQKRDYLAAKEKERQKIKAKIGKLSIKRDGYITEKLKETPDHDSFDEVVQEIIEYQAEGKGITY